MMQISNVISVNKLQIQADSLALSMYGLQPIPRDQRCGGRSALGNTGVK